MGVSNQSRLTLQVVIKGHRTAHIKRRQYG
jgi:hypothetical protein